MFIEFLARDPAFYVSVLFTLVLSTVLHELGHVFAALRQGDETPRLLGRVTLDPLVHMGATSLVMAALLGICWGVTPVNPARFRSRFGDALVSAAGPAVNVSLAIISLLALVLWMRGHQQVELAYASPGRDNVHLFLFVFGWWNLTLALFNLLPIPPLDGASVLGNFAPGYRRFSSLPEVQPWALAALIAVVMLTPLFAWGKLLCERFVHLFV